MAQYPPFWISYPNTTAAYRLTLAELEAQLLKPANANGKIYVKTDQTIQLWQQMMSIAEGRIQVSKSLLAVRWNDNIILSLQPIDNFAASNPPALANTNYVSLSFSTVGIPADCRNAWQQTEKSVAGETEDNPAKMQEADLERLLNYACLLISKEPTSAATWEKVTPILTSLRGKPTFEPILILFQSMSQYFEQIAVIHSKTAGDLKRFIGSHQTSWDHWNSFRQNFNAQHPIPAELLPHLL